ncbi:ATP-binding cassette domain-containing protein [Paracoccus sp. P2]|jgi:ABC-type uncharacterized transport system ATPase subunit|uniref:ATP-binding cassette domain-containing protein n=1 Tax=Paracoccus sp. P2 TaxID=3248840 RepID=UPI00391F0C3D
MTTLLHARGLTKRFKGLVANEDVDFDLEEGQVQCLIGPNGAGKTTFLSMLSGHLIPTAGTITFAGQDVTGLSVAERARRGIARKFQTPTVFDGLSTQDNIELAVLRRRLDAEVARQDIGDILRTIGLWDLREARASVLSHGQRQWLEIGLLIGIGAKVMLLDEPAAGMTNQETMETGKLIKRLAQERGLSIVVIEHDIGFIRGLDVPTTVLHLGRVIMRGSFAEVAADETVREVYLGTSTHA